MMRPCSPDRDLRPSARLVPLLTSPRVRFQSREEGMSIAFVFAGVVIHPRMHDTNFCASSGDFSLMMHSVVPLSVVAKSRFSVSRICPLGTATTPASLFIGIHTSSSPEGGLRFPPSTFTPKIILLLNQ